MSWPSRADHLQARLLLGDCYLKQGRFQDVVDLLAPWEASYAGDRGFAYILGTAFIQTDRVDQGQRVIDTIFKDGESAEGHLLMGTVHMNAGDSPAALAELRKAVELNPQLPVANGMLGRALLRNGEHEAALRAFLRELEINPDEFDTNLQVGELKKRDQQFDDARIYIERALRMRPDDAVARFALSGVYVSPGQERGGAAAARGRRRGRAEVRRGLRACSRPSTTGCSASADGDRMRARVEQLNAEAQARQPGRDQPAAQPPAERLTTSARCARCRPTRRDPCRARTSRRRCPACRRRRRRRGRASRATACPTSSVCRSKRPGAVCSSHTSDARLGAASPPTNAEATMSRSPSPSRSAACARCAPGSVASRCSTNGNVPVFSSQMTPWYGFRTKSSKVSPCVSRTSMSPSLSRSTRSMPDEPQFGCGAS